MSRVLPILFNTEMVRAILDGRKTVTRRVIKFPDGQTGRLPESGARDHIFYPCGIKYPPYQPGDILYVRETWCWEPCWDCGMDTEEHNCCNESANKFFNNDKGEWGCYGYKASLEDDAYPSADTWHPSIHMPKKAARIWLKVTDVRVERLQEITEEQAYSEGVIKAHDDSFNRDYWYYKEGQNYLTGNVWTESARQCFLWGIWNGTLKKTDYDRYCNNANPWVWVIEFERCEKPEREE